MKNCTPLCREAHFQVRKHLSVGALLEVEISKKWMPLWCEAHFRSQNAQSTPGSEHFWKHMSKPKCTNHFSVRPLLKVELSKTCTLLWREVHFEVKRESDIEYNQYSFCFPKTHQKKTIVKYCFLIFKSIRKS